MSTLAPQVFTPIAHEIMYAERHYGPGSADVATYIGALIAVGANAVEAQQAALHDRQRMLHREHVRAISSENAARYIEREFPIDEE